MSGGLYHNDSTLARADVENGRMRDDRWHDERFGCEAPEFEFELSPTLAEIRRLALAGRVDEARALARVSAPTAAGVVADAHGRTEASGAHPEGAATPSSTIREVAHVA